jgi:hypothetical protein
MLGAVAGLCWYFGALTNASTLASQIQRLSLTEFISSRGVQADAFRAFDRTRDPKVLDTDPIIYPNYTDLARMVDWLRAAGRWPATLSGRGNVQLPLLSRIARHAGLWGWGVIGLGVAAALMACRSRHGPKATAGAQC